MSIRIFLSSDLHLGMKFAAYADVQTRLAEERFRCLERLVDAASSARCDLLVIAGDLFERVAMARRDVERAAAILARFTGKLAAVLPGNHDYVAPDDELWRRFRDSSGERVLTLTEPRPLPLEHYDLPGVCLYPGPCTAKHSRTNAVGWVREAASARREPLGIGVAHGSVAGYSPDSAGDYYPMEAAQLLEAGPRLWLIGHTHLPFATSPIPGGLVLCAGTPEPDGFDCRHAGSASIVSAEETGMPAVEAVRTGGFRFLDVELALRAAADLESLASRFAPAEAERTLLRLTLTGTLPADDLLALEETRRGLTERLAYLDWRASAVRRRIDARAIEEEYPPGSFPHELLSSLLAGGDGAALEIASELLQESKP
jgi:exonuclease SbcD